MSYSAVQSERSHIYVTIVNKMITSNACTVGDVLGDCTPNTHKLIEYGYNKTNISYNYDSVFATKPFDGRGTHFSTAPLKTQELRID